MKKQAGILMLTVALLTLSQAGSLLAQSARNKAPKVIQLEEITIEGRVQKPNAFYILNRSNIGYEVTDLRTSFVKKVVISVDQDPF